MYKIRLQLEIFFKIATIKIIHGKFTVKFEMVILVNKYFKYKYNN